MRLAAVILILGATAVGLVHIRRTELSAQHEIQQLQATEIQLRRRLWDQQVHLSRLMSPVEVRRRALAMNLTDGEGEPPRVAYNE